MSKFIGFLKGHVPKKGWFESDVSISKNAAEQFASIYIAEALPVAFAEHLSSYDRARKMLARDLRVDFRDIQITGSAKIGFSLSPYKYLEDYDREKSDIDLFVVNTDFFNIIKMDATDFCEALETGKLRAGKDRDQNRWEENVRILKRNMPNSFIYLKYIPNLARFSEVQKAHDATYRFMVNFNNFSQLGLPKKCSIRVYLNWAAAMRRISFNISSAHQKRSTS